MPFCPNCGKEVRADAKFCPNCQFNLQLPTVNQSTQMSATASPVVLSHSSHRKRNIGLAVFAIFFVFILLGALGYSSNQAAADVNTTVLNYHYFCSTSNCSLSAWNYSIPFAYTLNENGTLKAAEPFNWPSTYACSVTIGDVHAVTPGFVFAWGPLPLTVQPGQNATVNFSLTAPGHPYSGPLDVDVSVTYC
jgi:hypothetical protein